MNWGDKWVRGAQSIMYLTDATIYNITTYDNSYFLYAGYKSTAYITNVSYLNWQAPFLISVISSVFTNGLSITSWNSLNEWYYNLRAPASSIINSVFSNCTSNNSTTSILILYSTLSSSPKLPTFCQIREGTRQRRFLFFKNLQLFLPK